MGPVKALQHLLDAFPRCCDCQDVAVVMNHDRWWLCERCFIRMPCSNIPPAVDARGPVYQAIAILDEEATKSVN